MKLFGYELYKIGSKRIFMISIFVLFILNAFFYYKSQLEEHEMLIQYRDAYLEMEKEYQGLTREAGMALSEKKEQLLTLYNTFTQENSNNQDSIWKQLVSEAKENNKQAYEDYKQSTYFNNAQLVSRDTYLNQLIKNQYDNGQQFIEDINAMADRAKEMLSVSIFYKEDSFSYRNILKTVEDFQPLQGLPLRLGLEESVTSGTNYWSTDLCMILLLFLLCTIIFQLEKEEGLTVLIRATRNGKLKTFGAKITALSMGAILLSIFYYGSILLLAEILYGFGDLTRYVQSMSAFSRASKPLTVEQYLVVFMVLKVAVNLLFAWLLALIFLMMKNTSRIYSALAILLGSSFVCYSLIHPNSYINVLKYINVAAFYDTFHLIADYRNLNIFSHPIPKDILTLLVGGGMMLLLPILSSWLYVTDEGIATKTSGVRWILRIKAYMFKVRLTNLLVQHESYKLFVAGKSVFIVIIACIIAFINVDGSDRQFDMESVVYNRYLSQLDAGGLNEDKLTFLREERARFTALPEQLAYWQTQYTSNKIDLKTYNQEKIKIEEFAKQEKSFLYVEKQKDYLQKLKKERGITGSFINVISSDALFNRQQADLLDSLVYCILLIVGLSPLFALDYKNGMIRVLRSTCKGRWETFASKFSIAYLFGLLMFYVLQLPKFYNVITHYPQMDWNAPVQSIESFGHVDWSVSLLEYVLMTTALQSLGVLILIHVVLFFAVLLEKQALMLLISTSLVILPLCLQYIGVKTIGSFTLNLIFQLYYAFKSNSYSTGICIYFGFLIFIGIAAAWGTWSVSNRISRRGN
ncbi:hypothetical protein [Paenibacillus chitinolyticus]|uniref:hypothetical protein n=1 Tax=Paenibacillus chitinolyticus TaxID=79263 RepID=UPI003D02986E